MRKHVCTATLFVAALGAVYAGIVLRVPNPYPGWLLSGEMVAPLAVLLLAAWFVAVAGVGCLAIWGLWSGCGKLCSRLRGEL